MKTFLDFFNSLGIYIDYIHLRHNHEVVIFCYYVNLSNKFAKNILHLIINPILFSLVLLYNIHRDQNSFIGMVTI